MKTKTIAILSALFSAAVIHAQPMLLLITESEFGDIPPGINSGISSFSVIEKNTNEVPAHFLAPGLTNETRKMMTFNMSIANVGADWDYLPFYMSTNYFFIQGKAFLRGLFGLTMQGTNNLVRSRLGFWGPPWDGWCIGARPRTHFPWMAGIQGGCTTYTEAQHSAFQDGTIFDITGLPNGDYTMYFTLDPMNIYGQQGPFTTPTKNFVLDVRLKHNQVRPK